MVPKLLDDTGKAPKKKGKDDGTGSLCFSKMQSRINSGSCPDWTDCFVCCGDLMPFGAETFGYDAKGNIVTASNQFISYTYAHDAAGRVTTVTDAQGNRIGYSYDSV